MRKIKFRAWDNKKEKMLNWQHLIGYCDIQFLFGGKSDPIHDIVPLQFTGAHDKNGKEIYEGDILKGNYMTFTTFNAVVRFGEYDQDGSGAEYSPSKCVGFYADAIKKDQKDEWDLKLISDYMETTSLLDFAEIEVIGNIYENPKLLESDS